MTKPTAPDPLRRSWLGQRGAAKSSVGEGEFAALADRSQLFGRERELTLLSSLFDNVGAPGGSPLIRGEAGIGKSALLAEAKRRADSRNSFQKRSARRSGHCASRRTGDGAHGARRPP
jgi:predicted ATP-dependent serine protease